MLRMVQLASLIMSILRINDWINTIGYMGICQIQFFRKEVISFKNFAFNFFDIKISKRNSKTRQKLMAKHRNFSVIITRWLNFHMVIRKYFVVPNTSQILCSASFV